MPGKAPTGSKVEALAGASSMGASVSSSSFFLIRNSLSSDGTEDGGFLAPAFFATGKEGCTSPALADNAPRSFTSPGLSALGLMLR